jgi:pimeloyl-ACP methyl ester carboxylesterase/DNA-binding CsgD family transcriptional regulator
VIPAVQFASSSNGGIAYQSVGEHDQCLLIVPPLAQNIEKMWEQPAFWRPIRRLASSVRFVHYDKLGTGASDPLLSPATLEDLVAELVAVLDDAEVGRAWLLGMSEGGMTAIAAAALVPERVEGLILVGTTSGGGARPDPDRHGPVRSAEESLRYFTAVADSWAGPSSLVPADFAPSLRWVPGMDTWLPAYERAAASPAMIHGLLAGALRLDATPYLGEIAQPTLVMHMSDDRVIPVAHGRLLADSIDGARLRVLTGDDHFVWVSPSVDEVIEEILATMGVDAQASKRYRGLTPWDSLTTAERRVARLVQRGLTNVEVARSTGTSVRTVETQLSRIYSKLDLRSRTELAIRKED